MGRGTSWKEYSCQEKETNFTLLNHLISQKKLQAPSCKKLQIDRPHRELLLHRYNLLQPGQPNSAIFLWSWPTQWKSLLFGQSCFSVSLCSWAAPFSQTLLWEVCKYSVNSDMTSSGFESFTWVAFNCLHYIFAFPKPGSAFMWLRKSRARQRAQEMGPCVPSDCTGYHLLYGCCYTCE